MNNTINIIGAGASGLLSSIILAKKGFDVTIFEKNSKAGRKILATGNGKCNISNQNLSYDNFFCTKKDFPHYALSIFDNKKFESFFLNIGLNTIHENGTKLYPMSLQASSVVDILYYEAKIHGVNFVFDSFIKDIKYNKALFEFKIENKLYKSKKLIIATGSAAMKKLGSSDSGYDIAKYFGHKIIKPFASLVQLNSTNKQMHKLSGIKTKSNITLISGSKVIKKAFGDILFTNYGVSGNAVLDISRDASYLLTINKKINLIVDILPNFTINELFKILQTRVQTLQNKEINYLLESIINKKLIPFIYQNISLPKTKKYIYQLNKKDISNIVNQLKNIKIDINSTRGFENAEVVAGGVDVVNIDNKTMQSKLQKNLYFCGEVLDVDGACGGYNLHWAWASAYIMANAI